MADKKYPSKKKKGVLTFIKNYILFRKKETNIIFEERFYQLTSKNKSMGIVEYIAQRDREEGLAKGRTEKEKIIVANLLSQTELSMRKIASLAQVSVYFVKKVKTESLN